MELSPHGPVLAREYKGLRYVSGPLLFLDGGRRFQSQAMVDIILPDGEVRTGQVLEVSESSTVVQVLESTAGRAQWLQSFVTGDKIYCVYIADSEASVREHAECGGFPANVIGRVATVIDPTTGGA